MNKAKKQLGTPKKSAKILPLGDRILVKPFSAEEMGSRSQYGIIIPETIDKEKPEQGLVLAVGEGRYEHGKLVPMRIKAGEKVLFSKYGYDEVKVGEEDYYILKEESVLAILEK